MGGAVNALDRWQRRHVGWYRRLLWLVPSEHRRRHGDAQVQLFADLLATGHRPWRLWAGAFVDVWHVMFLSGSRRLVMSHLARLALFPLSVLNAVVGLALATIALATTAVPAWVAFPALAITAQGAYSLAWLTGRCRAVGRVGDVVFAIGEAAALVVGCVGVVAAIVGQSTSGDIDYGPPTVLTIVAVHAVVGLTSGLGPRADLEPVR